MIKHLRVTVDGQPYDVTVESSDETGIPSQAAPPLALPAAPASGPPPPPVPAPAAAVAVPKPGPAGAAAAGEVPSPLAGRVTAIMVAVGQEVKEGDHLLTLEAMKMNTFVFAPRSGKAIVIKAAVGDAVEEGQGLMTIQ